MVLRRTTFVGRYRSALIATSLLALILAMAGCEDDKIREVRVPRERSGLEASQFQAGNTPAGKTPAGNRPGGPTGMGAMDSSAALERLLIAMIDRPDNTYFLRVQSPTVDAIDAIRPQFDQVVQSLKFPNNSIQWTLPEGWKEREGGAMFRIATLTAPSGIEIFVTKLTAGQEVLSNVNRWQNQLGLPEVRDAQPLIQTTEVGQQKVILYDARRAASNAQKAAAGESENKQAGALPPTGPTGESAAVPFVFPPLNAEWKQLQPSMMAVARWERTDPDGNLKLEVLKFPAEAAFLEMVSIWGERVQSPAPTETTFAEAVSKTTIAGLEAEVVTWPALEAESDAEAGAKAIQIARVVMGDQAWYIKLEGERTAVNGFAAGFQEFLANIQKAE